MALIAADALANALCLLMMLRLTGRRLCLRRTVYSALLGAFAAYALRISGINGRQTALFWLPVACTMTGLACGRWRLRDALVLLAASGLLGGTITALWGALGALWAAWIIGAGASCMMAAAMLRTQRALCDIHTARVIIRCCGRTVLLDAMVDSGNSLRDYLTHRPVIVMPQGALTLDGVPLRPIFADTAGGRQMMSCFTPQETIVETDGRRLSVSACIALSPALAADGPVLVPQSLLTQAHDWEG